MITRDQLFKDYSYDPVSGLFVRRSTKGKWKAGEIAGGLDAKGYIVFRVGEVKQKAHRMAFLYMTGEIPKFVDHRNTVRSDNRWYNLRDCNAAQNAFNRSVHCNNELGIKGVAWVEARNRFTGTVTCDGLTKSKDFKSLIEAIDWVERVRSTLHKEFANNG